MPILQQEILDFCEFLAKEESLQVTVEQSLKGGAIAGIGAVLGGVVLGPMGIALGGAVGGLAGAAAATKYKPLWKVIREMSGQNKSRLVAHMGAVISGLGISDIAVLMAIARNVAAGEREPILNEFRSFCTTHIGALVES